MKIKVDTDNKRKGHITIQIKRTLANKLKRMGDVGVSYNDTVIDLLNYYNATKTRLS